MHYQEERAGNSDRFRPFFSAANWLNATAAELLYNSSLCPHFKNDHELVLIFADRGVARCVYDVGAMIMPHKQFYAVTFGRALHDQHLRGGINDARYNEYDYHHYMNGSYRLYNLPPITMPAPVCTNQVAHATGEAGRRMVVVGMTGGALHIVNPYTGWMGGSLVRYAHYPSFEVSEGFLFVNKRYIQ